MAHHFHRVPIILSAESLRTLVTRYEQYTKNVEYTDMNDENYEKCRTSIALLESSLRQIKEAKEDLQKLYREIKDEHISCTDMSEKKEILTEIGRIEKESQLQTAIAEANDLTTTLTAKLSESKNTLKNMEIFLGYMDPRAQNLDSTFKDDSKIAQNIANNTVQNRNYMSLPLVSQASYSNQNRCNPTALLKKEIAANAYAKKLLGQKNNGKVTQSRPNHTSHRPNHGKGCIFCHKGNHSSVRCRTVSNKSMRRKIIKEQNRCWKCFSRDHNSFACQKQNCSSCEQKHQISLCLKKGKPQRNYGNQHIAKSMASNHPSQKNCQNCDQRSNKGQSGRRKSTSISTQMCVKTLTEPNFYADGSVCEQLVLMTAEGSIWNPRKQEYQKILFFFGSGAQRTVVDEELAFQLGLPVHTSEMCITSGIGRRMETFQSHVVNIRIATAFGEEIEITAQTKAAITSGFPSVKLEQSDIAFLKANEIYLANLKLRGEHQIPRVLVGLDYYHDLVIGNGARTSSGLHIAKTVFGHTIYGRGLSSVSQTNSVSYNLTAIREETEDQTRLENSELDEPAVSQRGENRKHSGEIVHAYGFTTVPFPLKEDVTDFEHNCSVAVRKLRPHLHPSAFNSSRRRPLLNVKPPPTPSSRRSPLTPATRRRPSRSRAVFRRHPPQEVDPRRTTTTRKKAKISDINSDNSCRPPEYHRQIDDPCSTHVYRRYCTSCGGGGADPSRARDTCS